MTTSRPMTTSGLMMYCFKHDNGFLIQGNTIPKKINQWCEGRISNACEWEDVGCFKTTTDEKVELYGPEASWYKKRIGWKESYFLENIYDKNMNKLEL